MLADTWHLFNKYLIITLRMPMWTLFGLAQPLIWLIIFGSLFSGFAKVPGFPDMSYTDYFLPGVLIMTVLFGSSWSGVSLIREITAGTVDKMLVSPVSRTAIVLSRVLHSAVQVIVQVIIVLVAASLMGANFSWHPFDIALALLVVLMTGIIFAAISNGLAIMLQREEPLVIMGNMMTLPLMFFSSAMVPQNFMPSWLQTAMVINPIEYGVTALRAILLPQMANTETMVTGLLVLSGFTIASMAWAITAFKSLRN